MAKHLKPVIKDLLLDTIDEPKGIVRMDIDPDALEDLSKSISEIGLLQNILVAVDGDRYEIVFGHRRWLACKKIGLSTIRALVREMTQQEIGIARATENISRADLTPIEEAATYKNLIDTYKMTLEQVAKKMGKTPGTIRRRMDLLRMNPLLQKAVHKRQISMTVAEEFWPISDEDDLEYYLTFAIESGCTKDTARKWCKEWRDSKRRERPAGDGGGQTFAPTEPRPVYVACDICVQAMEIGKETVLRICPACHKVIKESM